MAHFTSTFLRYEPRRSTWPAGFDPHVVIVQLKAQHVWPSEEDRDYLDYRSGNNQVLSRCSMHCSEVLLSVVDGLLHFATCSQGLQSIRW